MENDTRESQRVHVKRRRSTQERGYGVGHQGRRRVLAPFVNAGLATCVRCGEPIAAGEDWHLGHDDYDRTRWKGPEHVRCNCGAPNRLRTSRTW
jgi:hypothetical protein